MPDEHVEIVRRLTDAINSGTVPPELLTEDFELRNATTAIMAGVFWFRGRRIARAIGYNRRRAALEAVGLSK